jgi:hypothetical protein
VRLPTPDPPSGTRSRSPAMSDGRVFDMGAGPSPPVVSWPFVPFAGAVPAAARVGMALAGGGGLGPLFYSSLTRTVSAVLTGCCHGC